MDGSNIIIEAPDTNRDVLANYLFEAQTLTPSADGNWSFVPVKGDLRVMFSSAPDAKRRLGPNDPIEKVGVDEEGYGRYRLILEP